MSVAGDPSTRVDGSTSTAEIFADVKYRTKGATDRPPHRTRHREVVRRANSHGDLEPPRRCLQFTDDGSYALDYTEHEWHLIEDAPIHGDVIVRATTPGLARLISSLDRSPNSPDISVEGRATAVKTFHRALAPFPDAVAKQ